MRNNKLQAWLAFLSSSLFLFYCFILINLFNINSQKLMNHFAINSVSLGYLSSAFFYANFIFIFPAGILIDRIATRKLILIAMIIAVTTTFTFILTNNYYIAFISRFLSGMAGAFCFLGSIHLASRWFKPQQMGFVLGLLITIAMLGGLMAQAPLNYLGHTWGWRQAIMGIGILGIGFLIFMWVFLHTNPNYHFNRIQENHTKNNPMLFAIKNYHNWAGAIYAAMVNAPIFILGAIWGNLYLTQSQHLSEHNASLITSLLFIGTIVGSPLIGLLSDKIKNRKQPMFICAILAFIVSLFLLSNNHLSIIYLAILFFLFGMIAGAQSLSFTITTELNPSNITGSANSIISAVVVVSGFVFQPLFGSLITYNTHLQFSNNDIHLGMMIFPVLFAIAIFCVFWLKETGAKAYSIQNNEGVLP
ncbi:MAG: MFS transporter [Legionellales bacterium]|nr:MFS transporter [Legionellales bacterium]